MIKLLDILLEGKRIPRKKGQKRKSKKHSDLYTVEDPKGTIHGLKFATVKDAEASVRKIKSSGRTHAHKVQAAVAMEQRAKAAGKVSAAAVYRKYINSVKKSEEIDEVDYHSKLSRGHKPDYYQLGTSEFKPFDKSRDDRIRRIYKASGIDMPNYDLPSEQSSPKEKSFPMEIFKDGKKGKVSNEQELKEARAEGWETR